MTARWFAELRPFRAELNGVHRLPANREDATGSDALERRREEERRLFSPGALAIV